MAKISNKTVGEVKVGGMTKSRLEKVAQVLAENVADTLDSLLWENLVGGHDVVCINQTRWSLFKITLHDKIKDIRISLAEWIGGEDLHEHCEY